MTVIEVPRWKRMRSVLTYRGGEGHWSWLLHRVTGLGVVLFLFLHILDIWLVGMGREVFERFLFLYHSPVGKVMEVFLLFGVLFHAVNGARIILIDLVPGMERHQKSIVYLETVILLAVFVPAAWVTLRGLVP